MTSSPTPAVLPDARALLAEAYERANLTCPAADVRSGNKIDWVRENVALDAIAHALATPPASDAAVPAGHDMSTAEGRWKYYRSPDSVTAAVPKVASDTGAITQEWCLRMADLEAGQEIGAGALDHPLRTKCELPPAGWVCTREPGHDGPCAAVASDTGAGLASKEDGTDNFYRYVRPEREAILVAVERNWNAGPDVLTDAILAVLATPTDAMDGATGGGEVEPWHKGTPVTPSTVIMLGATTPGGDLLEQAIAIVNEEGPQNPESDWTDYARARATMRDNILKRIRALKPAGDGGEA